MCQNVREEGAYLSSDVPKMLNFACRCVRRVCGPSSRSTWQLLSLLPGRLWLAALFIDRTPLGIRCYFEHMNVVLLECASSLDDVGSQMLDVGRWTPADKASNLRLQTFGSRQKGGMARLQRCLERAASAGPVYLTVTPVGQQTGSRLVVAFVGVLAGILIHRLFQQSAETAPCSQP